MNLASFPGFTPQLFIALSKEASYICVCVFISALHISGSNYSPLTPWIPLTPKQDGMSKGSLKILSIHRTSKQPLKMATLLASVAMHLALLEDWAAYGALVASLPGSTPGSTPQTFFFWCEVFHGA